MIFWLMICQLVDGDYLSIVREKHLAVDHRWDSRHSISVAAPQNNFIIKRGVNDFNVNANSLTGEGDRTITKQANGLGGMTIPRSKGDHGRG